MSQYVKYRCPSCGRRATNSGVQPLKCGICDSVICRKCSKNAICQTCESFLTPEQRKRISDASSKQKVTGCLMVLGIFAAMGLMVPILYMFDSIIMMFVPFVLCICSSCFVAANSGKKYREVCSQVKNELINTPRNTTPIKPSYSSRPTMMPGTPSQEGSPVATSRVPPSTNNSRKNCPSCGFQLQSDDIFCGNCGYRM